MEFYGEKFKMKFTFKHRYIYLPEESCRFSNNDVDSKLWQILDFSESHGSTETTQRSIVDKMEIYNR